MENLDIHLPAVRVSGEDQIPLPFRQVPKCAGIVQEDDPRHAGLPRVRRADALEGKCFACLGNHDHEAPEHVRAGLASAGVKLLVDAMTEVETPAGPVEVLGFDFRWRDRKAHLEAVSAQNPRKEGLLRIALLHDPGAFRHVPEGTADLVLSGHTHGGQLGLLWFGLPHTFVSAVASMPDHGLWSRGKDRLYVHRGTGHYGFPLRLGVPSEESVLSVHRAA